MMEVTALVSVVALAGLAIAVVMLARISQEGKEARNTSCKLGCDQQGIARTSCDLVIETSVTPIVERTGHKTLGDNMSKIKVSFKSGHYRVFIGYLEVQEIWLKFKSKNGMEIFVNRSEVEYYETIKKDCEA